MGQSKEQIAEMIAKATAVIPSIGPQPEPPANNPVPEATPADTGSSPEAMDLFGDLSASMDAEVSGVQPEPEVPAVATPGGQPPIEVPPFEPSASQVALQSVPDQLIPTPVTEVPLEAAIEQPLAEEDLRLTAEQWASSQAALAPAAPPEPVAEPQFNPAELEAKAIEALRDTEYKLTDEQATMLIAEPDKVLPELAARMHVRVQVQLANQLASILPGMIAGQIERLGKVQSVESSFFAQYPTLNRPEFRTTVQESLAMIRQVNPKATREEVMRDGAALAAIRLKTRLGGAQEPAQMPVLGQPPAAIADMPLSPANPSQPVPAQPQAQFTPAQAGGASVPVVPTDPNAQNIFAQLAEDPDW